MPRRIKIGGVVTGAWTVFGTLLAQPIYALRANNNESTSWPHALLYELVYCYAWALLTPVVCTSF